MSASSWKEQNGRPLTEPFHVMTKPTGPLCNLDCEYCFYLEKEKLYPDTRSWTMSDEVLESWIQQYIESQPLGTITFAWQGGEPTLLGIPWFQKVLSIQRKYAQGARIENVFQTNAVLVDATWAEFFAENDFLIGFLSTGRASCTISTVWTKVTSQRSTGSCAESRI